MNRLLALTTLACALAAWAVHPAAADDAEKPYKVVDGKVDSGTFNGWRRYDNNCLRCHGPDGAGSSYAPALTDSLQHMSHDDFANTVINGRQNVSSSQQNVMPAFGYVADVAEYIDDIYAYLKARSDGVVGRGRPEKLPADQDPKKNG